MAGLFIWIAPAVSAQERLLSAFFDEDGHAERQSEARLLVASGATFMEVHSELAVGRVYAAAVETGRLEWSHKIGAERHRYVVLVPDDYDPKKAYRVCFYLHGGVNRQGEPEEGGSWWRRFDRFDGVEQISVFPASWPASLWWHKSQVENLERVLDRIKLSYHVDENRVFLFGVSDGGTGVYYHAMKAPTIWASFFPFIGQPAVLSNPATGVEGEMFERNLAGTALYIVNGESDRLYPAARMLPFVEVFRELGADVVFRSRAGGHNTRWWNQETSRLEAFMSEHRRDPLPERLVWETADTKNFGRRHWLVVDALSKGRPAGGIFPHEDPYGRVVIERSGNGFEAMTTGVRRFRILLSPREVEFSSPIRVSVNGEVVFDDRIETSVETLLRWAAIDDDKSMLFGAELAVDVP